MSDWKKVKLGDFFNVKHGYAFKGKYITKEPTKDILVTPGNFHIGGGFKNSKNKYYSSDDYPKGYVLKTGDIVITMTDLSKETDTLGYAAKIPMSQNEEKYLHNQRVGLVEFKNQDADADYLYWKMRTRDYQWYIVGSASGTSIMHTSPSRIEDFDFLIHTFSEQKAIASVLSSLDNKIDLLHRQNKTLEVMAETIFREWFLEGVKEDWEQKKIIDFDCVVTDYVANGSFASIKDNVKYTDIPDYAILIRLTDFNRDFNGDFVYVNQHAYEFLSKSKLVPNDIIISNVGAYAGTVFKCPNLKTPMTLGPNSIVVKSNYNNYFYYLFKSEYGQYRLDGIMSGSAQPKFNKTAFRNIELSYSSITQIEDFENEVKPYVDKVEINHSQIKILENLRDTLLPKLMSGEIRIPTDE